MAKTLTDKCPMPYGVHKGTPMKDVPAAYLIQQYDSEYAWVEENHPEVYDYIEVNLDSIEADIACRKGRDY